MSKTEVAIEFALCWRSLATPLPLKLQEIDALSNELGGNIDPKALPVVAGLE